MAIGGVELRDSWFPFDPQVVIARCRTGISVQCVVSRWKDGTEQRKTFTLIYDSSEKFVDFSVGFTSTLILESSQLAPEGIAQNLN